MSKTRMPVPYLAAAGLKISAAKAASVKKTRWDKPIRHYADMVNKT